jgi:hypothetical protein
MGAAAAGGGLAMEAGRKAVLEAGAFFFSAVVWRSAQLFAC